jgi:hypothetical protein
MRWLGRLFVVMVAFGAGVLADAIGVAIRIRGFECTPGTLEPCDGGPMLALGAFVVTAPVAGLLAVIAAVAWMVLRAHRATRAQPAAKAASS